MPSYNATIPREVNVGDQLALVDNAAVDSAVSTTQQFAVGPAPGASSYGLNIINSTNQQAVGQLSTVDLNASYQPAAGMIVPANTALPYNVAGGWCRFTFVTPPTSGSLIVGR